MEKGLARCTTGRDNTNMMLREAVPSPSLVASMGWERDQAVHASFWNGDPTKQSFISVVGLSTPRASRTRPRPSSAPARGVKAPAPGLGFKTPRTANASNHANFEVGEEHTDHGGLDQRARNRGGGSETSWRLEDEMGRVRILEHRLRQLKQENACMRDAMLNKADDLRLERLVQAQKRSQELIAALQMAKEGAEVRARRTQQRVRTLLAQVSITRMLLLLGVKFS